MATKMISVNLPQGMILSHSVSAKTNTGYNNRCEVLVCAMTGSHSQPSHPKFEKLSEETVNYLIGETPVTQALWQEVMGNNPSHFIKNTSWSDCLKNYSKIGSDIGGQRNAQDPNLERPVERVSWFDCVLFCNKLSELEGLQPAYTIGEDDEPNVEWDKEANGYRLPTLFEWEQAAKAGQDFIYAGSDNIDEVAWVRDNTHYNMVTQPVAQKKANGYGLYDMSGNVSEWCWDQDQDIPPKYNYRLTLGGSVRSEKSFGYYSSCVVGKLRSDEPTARRNYVGFRLAKNC